MSTQTNLKEPAKINWDDYHTGSKYQPPPPALGPDGKPIQYFAQVKTKFEESKDFGVTDNGDRSYNLGPLTMVKNGGSVDGYQIKFAYVSTKQFEKNGQPINANSVGNFLRSAGIQSKPQSNAEYDQAVRATAGRVVPITLDWEARNKDTGEEVKGFLAFPMDPDRPGQRKTILKAGDQYNILDQKGQPTGQTGTVKSEVLFANARVKYFRDPMKK